MISQDAPTVTDELIAELEAAANAATPQDLDSAEEITKADPGAMIECPVCCGEGYASIENDYCNFDNHAIGVQFYGIGPEFGAGERYFRAANPATILALLAERADLKLQLAAARVDAERYDWLREMHNDEYGCLWVSHWDYGQVAWVSLDAFYRPGYDGELDLDAAIDAARNIGSGD